VNPELVQYSTKEGCLAIKEFKKPTGHFFCMRPGTISILFALIATLLFSNGCVALLAGGAAGTVSGLEYTHDNIARKTFTARTGELSDACVLALKEMAIDYSGPLRTGDGFRIRANTSTLKINIDIERITPQASQIQVAAKKNFILMDRATASEIIRRTETFIGQVAGKTAMRMGQKSVP
jgi:hypothetical protein